MKSNFEVIMILAIILLCGIGLIGIMLTTIIKLF